MMEERRNTHPVLTLLLGRYTRYPTGPRRVLDAVAECVAVESESPQTEWAELAEGRRSSVPLRRRPRPAVRRSP